MVGVIGLLAAGLALAWAVSVATTVRRLVRPPRRGYGSQVSRGLPGDPSELARSRRFDEWTHTSADGVRTPVWTIDGDDPGGVTVVFCHGWGESRHAVLARVEALAARCARIIAMDLPGHGESSARESPLGTREHELVKELVDGLDEGARERGVVLHGFSLGAGVCLRAAAEMSGDVSGAAGGIAGVIAESPYRLHWTPAERVTRASGVPTTGIVRPALWWVGWRRGDGWRGFDRAEIARRVGCAVLVVHGAEDGVSPVEDGRAIAEAARGEIVEIAGARHNDLWTTHASESGAAAAGFLERAARDWRARGTGARGTGARGTGARGTGARGTGAREGRGGDTLG